MTIQGHMTTYRYFLRFGPFMHWRGSPNPPSGNVPRRVNSPLDHEFAAFDSAVGDIAVTTTLLNNSFAVANTAANGIHASPNQFAGGEGPANREEVLFTSLPNTPVARSLDHYFFPPEDFDPQRQSVGAGDYLPKYASDLDMIT